MAWSACCQTHTSPAAARQCWHQWHPSSSTRSSCFVDTYIQAFCSGPDCHTRGTMRCSYHAVGRHAGKMGSPAEQIPLYLHDLSPHLCFGNLQEIPPVMHSSKPSENVGVPVYLSFKVVISSHISLSRSSLHKKRRRCRGACENHPAEPQVLFSYNIEINMTWM